MTDQGDAAVPLGKQEQDMASGLVRLPSARCCPSDPGITPGKLHL